MGSTFKVIVAGGRDFKNYDLLKRKLDHILQNQTNIEIVSGVAAGADLLGEKYAAEKKYPIKRFHADWDNFGRSAGPRRNEEMAQYAQACVCFWDQRSSGTRSMISLAKKYKLKLLVVHY